MKALDSLEIIVKALDEKQGENITVLDFENRNPLADYFVICHGNTDRQINALVDNVIGKLEANNITIRKIEGNENSGWQLIDTSDVIVHIFSKEDRVFYNLEKLWLDIKRVDVNEII